MSRRRKVFGQCHICCENGPLSFEHVPPKSAFNNSPIKQYQGLMIDPQRKRKGTVSQRGAGDYTLCVECNTKTGQWYGSHFVSWCKQGANLAYQAKVAPSLFYTHHIFPLAIVKQIISMFLSINSIGMSEANPELVEFVLNKRRKYLSPKYRFFMYFNLEGIQRNSGIARVLDTKTGTGCTLSEISYPPYGYVMTFRDAPPDDRLFEITHFSRYGYDEGKSMSIQLPVLPTHTGLPGDYRAMKI